MNRVIQKAPFADALVALGERRKDVVVLSADLSKYTDVLPFAQKFPNRFIQVGMAEQNMMGIAGGLKKAGFLPIAVTYGCLLYTSPSPRDRTRSRMPSSA